VKAVSGGSVVGGGVLVCRVVCIGGAGGGICGRCVGAVLEAVFVYDVWGWCWRRYLCTMCGGGAGGGICGRCVGAVCVALKPLSCNILDNIDLWLRICLHDYNCISCT